MRNCRVVRTFRVCIAENAYVSFPLVTQIIKNLLTKYENCGIIITQYNFILISRMRLVKTQALFNIFLK